jgi:hypothetical protein
MKNLKKVSKIVPHFLFSNFAKCFFVIFAFSHCSSDNQKKDSQESPKVITELYPMMYEMLNELTQLQPFMVSESEFKDPKNKSLIRSRLEKLSSLSESVMRHKTTQVPTYRISGEALNNHIQQLLRLNSSPVAEKNSSYARWMLASTPFACMSCHSQLERTAKPLWNIEEETLKGSDFEKAEFLFSTHNYTIALNLYNKIIRGFNSTEGSQAEVSKSLSHKMTLLVRVFKNLKEAENSLNQDLKNPALPKNLRSSIKNWISQLRRLRQLKFFQSYVTPTLGDTIRKTNDLLDKSPRGFVSAENPNLVEYLYLSGLLYEFLQKETAESLNVPEILLALGRLDQGLNQEFFFALDQLYLKECIDKFPTHPTAKKCYFEYRSEMERLFTGTRGLDLPQDLAEQLENAKQKVGL